MEKVVIAESEATIRTSLDRMQRFADRQRLLKQLWKIKGAQDEGRDEPEVRRVTQR